MSLHLVLRKIAITLGSFHLDIDLDVHAGSFGIFGPSGSGKTTLLELIAGLRRPHAGEIHLDGDALADPVRQIWIHAHRRRIGYVPQDLALFPHLKVRGNIAYGLLEKDSDSLLNSLCEVLDLIPLLDRYPETLSGGERQRVALARALAAQPRLLLLDEPLTGLDFGRKEKVMAHLKMLREHWNVPMIYVSHQADEVAALCDEMIILREGKIQGRGSPAELFEISDRPSYRLRDEFYTGPQSRHLKDS